ncbi:MAG: hypothetical protein ED859_15220 [Desulfuromonadales bacterium]|nr:MAG: hypothetical protein ED859_15220 [Desulfuromonadales bacterium]
MKRIYLIVVTLLAVAGPGEAQGINPYKVTKKTVATSSGLSISTDQAVEKEVALQEKREAEEAAAKAAEEARAQAEANREAGVRKGIMDTVAPFLRDWETQKAIGRAIIGIFSR